VLSHDYPSYSTVYNFYSRAKQKGTWEKVMQFLIKETRKIAKDFEYTSLAEENIIYISDSYLLIKRLKEQFFFVRPDSENHRTGAIQDD